MKVSLSPLVSVDPLVIPRPRADASTSLSFCATKSLRRWSSVLINPLEADDVDRIESVELRRDDGFNSRSDGGSASPERVFDLDLCLVGAAAVI